MNRLAVIVAFLALAGCASTPVPIADLSPKQKAALSAYVESIDDYNDAVKP